MMRPRDVHRYDFFNNADFELLDIGIPCTVFERLCDYLQLDRAIFVRRSCRYIVCFPATP